MEQLNCLIWSKTTTRKSQLKTRIPSFRLTKYAAGHQVALDPKTQKFKAQVENGRLKGHCQFRATQIKKI